MDLEMCKQMFFGILTMCTAFFVVYIFIRGLVAFIKDCSGSNSSVAAQKAEESGGTSANSSTTPASKQASAD
jgi:hypothetical protein